MEAHLNNDRPSKIFNIILECKKFTTDDTAPFGYKTINKEE